MKSKKVTMLVAALVVAVVALAGIGYATSYTGTTTNGGNSADVTYVKLSQGGTYAYDNTNSFIGSEYYNTVTTGVNTTTYTVTGTQSVPIGDDTPVTAYVISKTGGLQLIVEDTEENAEYQLDITTSTNIGVAQNSISYYFGVKKTDSNTINWSEAGVYTTVTTWTITGLTEGTYDVYVAAAGQSTSQPTGFSGTTFSFVVSAPMV